MDKTLLFEPRAPENASGMPEDDVELPAAGSWPGGTVRVRALSRKEAMSTGKIEDVVERTAHIIAIAMLDPVLSVSEVKRWSEVAMAGELDPVDTKIAELSGMLPDAAKAAYKSNGSGPDDRIRSLPGAEAGDDGSSTVDGDL